MNQQYYYVEYNQYIFAQFVWRNFVVQCVCALFIETGLVVISGFAFCNGCDFGYQASMKREIQNIYRKWVISLNAGFSYSVFSSELSVIA